MKQLEEEKKKIEEEARILEQAATYMAISTSQEPPQDNALINTMREEATKRRSRLRDIVSMHVHVLCKAIIHCIFVDTYVG